MPRQPSEIVGSAGSWDRSPFPFRRPPFFSPLTSTSTVSSEPAHDRVASLNTLGYSPVPLRGYLDFIAAIADEFPTSKKPFIVSVTGTAEEVAECHDMIRAAAAKLPMPLA